MTGRWQKALTVYQPWASLIISGFKPYEFRSWNYVERGLGRLTGQLIAWRSEPHRLPLSSMLGTVVLGAPRLGEEIAVEFGATKVNDSTRDDEAQFGWPMIDPQPLEPIVPMRGRQTFWNWRQVP